MSRSTGVAEPENPTHVGINSYGVACAVSRAQPMDAKELRGVAADLMRAISESAVQRGAKDIGHIKAYLEYPGGFLHANTVGDPADISVEGSDGPPMNTVRLTVNAVVFGLDAPAVRAATEASMKKVFEKFRLQREPDKPRQSRNLGGETP